MKTLFVLLITLIYTLLIWVPNSLAEQVRVIRVIDADTLVVEHKNTSNSTVRLACIDGPEIARAIKDKNTTDEIKKDQFLWGDIASEAVKQLLKNNNIDIKVTDIDIYGRYIADISLANGKNLQTELLKKGIVQIYPKYFKVCPNAVDKAAAQYSAHENNLGIWSDKNYVSPWTFRSRYK